MRLTVITRSINTGARYFLRTFNMQASSLVTRAWLLWCCATVLCAVVLLPSIPTNLSIAARPSWA